MFMPRASAPGGRMRIFMDLGGPKVRTGEFRALHHDKHVQIDDLIALVAPGNSTGRARRMRLSRSNAV